MVQQIAENETQLRLLYSHDWMQQEEAYHRLQANPNPSPGGKSATFEREFWEWNISGAGDLDPRPVGHSPAHRHPPPGT